MPVDDVPGLPGAIGHERSWTQAWQQPRGAVWCGLLLSSCSGPPQPDGLGAAAEPAGTASQITDQECLVHGGRIATEQDEAYLRRRPPRPGELARPYRVCRIPAPENGRTCASSGECGLGRCRCEGELARPDPANDPALRALDGTAAAGRCSDTALPSGCWWCLVEDGRVVLHGVVFD